MQARRIATGPTQVLVVCPGVATPLTAAVVADAIRKKCNGHGGRLADTIVEWKTPKASKKPQTPPFSIVIGDEKTAEELFLQSVGTKTQVTDIVLCSPDSRLEAMAGTLRLDGRICGSADVHTCPVPRSR